MHPVFVGMVAVLPFPKLPDTKSCSDRGVRPAGRGRVVRHL